MIIVDFKMFIISTAASFCVYEALDYVHESRMGGIHYIDETHFIHTNTVVVFNILMN